MKFHFVVPDLHVLIEADSIEDAKTTLMAATCTEEIDGDWDLLGFNGEPEQIRACIVCGCTDDMSCQGGCYWAGYLDAGPVCSFLDEEHRLKHTRSDFAEEDALPLAFEVQS